MNKAVDTAKPDKIPSEIAALIDAINELPLEYREKLKPLVVKVRNATIHRRRVLLLIQDSLSQFRLDIKYLAFDLEATRRERDKYRRELK